MKTDFIQLIASENVEAIRDKLFAIASANPDLGNGEFTDCLKYAENKIGEEKLYEAYNSSFIASSDQSEWNTAYVSRLFLAMRRNFSKSLIQHFMEVAPKVYKEKAYQRDLQRQTPEPQVQQEEKMESLKSERKYLTIGVCVVVALILIVLLLKKF